MQKVQEVDKEGNRDGSRLCFALADFGGHRATAGVDARELDPARNTDGFLDRCLCRAGILTDFMREVRWALREVETAQKRRVPLVARITDDGFTANLFGGIDIETWCEEGLVDTIITQPLQWVDGIWVHDVRPYVDLGRRTGTKVIGGVNAYPVENGWRMNPVRIALRVRETQEAGVAGIALYGTNDSVLRPEPAPLIQAIRNNRDLAALLADRAWVKQLPMDGLDSNCGMDGHSCLRSLWLSRI